MRTRARRRRRTYTRPPRTGNCFTVSKLGVNNDGQYSLGTAVARVVAAVVCVDGIRIELRENLCV